jgi:hypothetical protein
MCEEKAELEGRLNRSALRLSSALDDECLGALQDGADIGRLQKLVKDAESEWDNAKAALGRHRHEHGC